MSVRENLEREGEDFVFRGERENLEVWKVEVGGGAGGGGPVAGSMM